MKKTLVFDDQLDGHHLEYLNHIYIGATKKKDEEFIFLVNPNFKVISNKLLWPQSSNIIIDFISEADIVKLKTNKIFKAFYLCKILKKVLKKYNCNNIFLISLMAFMPFLPFFINKKIKISGIIYLIFLYRWRDSSIQKRFLDVIKYVLFAKFKTFENIYLLNDDISPIYLNKKFKTKVFSYLPDPFIPLQNTKLRNLRNELNVPTEKTIYLHFGALAKRKGTLDILEAISITNDMVLRDTCFIFAGKISDDIKNSFYLLTNKLQCSTQIIIYDKFLDYEFIGSLCLTSDYILIPYRDSEQSSGVIGYAAQFNVPVVGPSNGLLGKLIKKYKLGYRLKNNSVKDIVEFINGVNNNNNRYTVKTTYLNDRTKTHFVNIILK